MTLDIDALHIVARAPTENVPHFPKFFQKISISELFLQKISE